MNSAVSEMCGLALKGKIFPIIKKGTDQVYDN